MSELKFGVDNLNRILGKLEAFLDAQAADRLRSDEIRKLDDAWVERVERGIHADVPPQKTFVKRESPFPGCQPVWVEATDEVEDI